MNLVTRKLSAVLAYLCISLSPFSEVLQVQSVAISVQSVPSVPVSVPSIPVSSTTSQSQSQTRTQTEYEKYIDALLQSTGLKPPNPEFLEKYYDRLYGEVNVNTTELVSSKLTPSLPDPLPHPYPHPRPLPGPITLPPHTFTRPPTPRIFTLPPTPRIFTRPPSPTWRPFPYPFPEPFPNPNDGCICVGCMVNGECIECLNELYCRRVGGTYC